MQVISVVNRKGGAGKTTIATNVATTLAMRGKKVLIIDTDKKQESSLNFAQIRNDNNQLADIAAMAVPVKSLYKDVRNYTTFDYVVIDAGAGDDKLVEAAVLCSSYGIMLLPMQPSVYDLWGSEDTLNILKKCQELTEDVGIKLDNNYIVLNRVTGHKNAEHVKQMRETLPDFGSSYNIACFDTEIHERAIYKDSIAEGMNVIEFQKAHPKKKNLDAEKELNQLVDEILNRLQKAGDSV